MNSMNIKDNIRNKDTWLRGLLILLFSVVLCVSVCVIALLGIFQFLNKLITGQINTCVKTFCVLTLDYIANIIKYMTFQSEATPFPFSLFNNTDSAKDDANAVANADSAKDDANAVANADSAKDDANAVANADSAKDDANEVANADSAKDVANKGEATKKAIDK